MIRVEGLTKRYAGAQALDSLSFEVPEGEIFGFVGENGAGKTTTLRILATLLQPTSGAAWVDGVDVTAKPGEVRWRIGYMPDFFGVYDRLTAAEYLAFYARCYYLPQARVDGIVSDLLELIGLDHKRDAAVDTLSRGMKQRLCLARALVHDPALLLLDEPASGLDPKARIEMRELLKELTSMGKTIVISSHILPELTELCTYYGIIHAGKMVATGSLDSLRSAGGRSRRVRVRVGGDPAEAARLLQQDAAVGSVSQQGDMLEVRYEGGEPESAALVALLVGAGQSVLAFAPVEEDLEEAFMRVMGEGASN